MSSRHWVFAFAFGIACAAAPFLEAQDKPDEDDVDQEAAQSQTSEQRSVEPDALEVRTAPAPIPGKEHYASAPANGDGDPVDNSWVWLGDGVAQWVMAILNFVAVGISAWAVWLLYATLRATRAAVHEAAAATKAAELAVEVTREMGIIQTRPYLGTTTSEVVIGEAEIWCRITVKNMGQSPAVNARFTTAWAGEIGEFNEIWTTEIDDSANLGSVMPGAEVHAVIWTAERPEPDRRLTPEQIREVTDGTRSFWVYGRIDYDDPFGGQHFTKYRKFLVKSSKAGGQPFWRLILCREGNNAS